MPDDEEAYVRCEGDGFVVFVHRDVAADLPIPGQIRFAFGSLGWCRVGLRDRDEAR